MWWLAIALAACRFAAVAEHAPCPAPQVWPSQLTGQAAPPPPPPGHQMDDSSHTVRSSATPTTVRFSEATVPPSPELSVRSTSRSSPRPTLEKMLTSRSFHTLQSSALDKLRRRKRGECTGDTSGKSDWCRETVFPELYFGGLVEALEEHMANGDLVFPEGK